jgi:hypothetical protein
MVVLALTLVSVGRGFSFFGAGLGWAGLDWVGFDAVRLS